VISRPAFLTLLAAAGILTAGCAVQQRTSPLSDPADPRINQQAPPTYRARFETSTGEFVVEVQRAWAPLGADRFYNLVANGFYDGARFFRVVPGFVVQFGIPGEPALSAAWAEARIADDPVRESNLRGRVTFATAGPNTRTSQVFINLADNPGLDRMGFAAFGTVVEGMEVVDNLYAGYGEGAPMGGGPDQARIRTEGNVYLEAEFPRLDYVVRATIVGQR
jgi:peptidyl-prolyl cis-trans isomerase A (cyclophilin A)